MNHKTSSKLMQYNTVPASQNSLQTIHIEKPKRIIPIIFIPGVMGSNLKEKTIKSFSKPIWRLNSSITAVGWSLPHYGTATVRKLELDPDKTEVDDRGTVVDAAVKECDQIESEYNKQISEFDEDDVKAYLNAYKIKQQKIEEAINNNPENILFGTRRERGWGSVAYISYGNFLETFQQTLFTPNLKLSQLLASLINKPQFSVAQGSKSLLTLTKEQIEHCDAFTFPVYAMGYNWLQSNADSANELKQLVEVTIPTYYKKRGRTCDKVILVTHSMGGLVARYYTEALGGGEKVYGVINGVQPAIGAAAAYTRMKRGTEVNSTFWGKLEDSIMENVLGKDAAEMTAVCAQSPGPLQLLPTPEYGLGWLTITDPDGKSKLYPKADPYTEIYLAKDKWWCVCEPHLINPLNTNHNQSQMKLDWSKYEKLIDKVQIFHQEIANKYHANTYAFFGIEDDKQNIRTEYLTYQTVHWQGSFTDSYQASLKQPATDHIGAADRLDLSELSALRTISPRRNDWIDVDIKTTYAVHRTKHGHINETYRLASADSNGDGTVPQRSGEIPLNYLTARMHLPVGHEAAYRSGISQEFTLRAIVDILQKVMVND